MELSTPAGRFRGSICADGKVSRFLGIPYAQPPVGELRWRAPQKLAPGSGVRDATRFGNASLQRPRPANSIMFFGDEPSSEDCLYLNVWAPVQAQRPLPVLVWIHGGGFYYGSGSLSKYDGQALTSRGAVVVTINYRLGPLGFLAHPELSAESAWHTSGNYGLLDQIAALEWVRDTIEAFHGDPSCVTIFGQSVGSASVNALMASPMARGLFHRAIAQSGGSMGHLGPAGSGCMQTLAGAEEAGLRFARRLDAASLDALRRKPAAEVQFFGQPLDGSEKDYMALMPMIRQSGWPIVDGAVVERANVATFRAGLQAAVPLITGWNKDEGSASPAPTTFDALKAWLHATYGGFADRILAHYSDGRRTPAEIARLIIGHRGFCWQNRTLAQLHATTSAQPTFVYRFTHVPPMPEGQAFAENSAKGLGAFHTAEIPYVFDNLQVRTWPWRQRDRELAEQMSRYWIGFAQTGNPNHADDLPAWPQYATTAGTVPQVLQFGEITQGVDEPMRDTFALWDAYFAAA
jgi:para-nitrobenzyl esterase